MPDNHTILMGVVGSTAYGLDHADSDVDQLGLFVTPTIELVGLTRPKDTFSSNGPDIVLHEVGKFCSLALKGNPTVLELLFLDKYSILEREGQALVSARDKFLGATEVRNAYIGYANSQIKRLNDRGDFGSDLRKRYAKHARHCFRLLLQAEQLLQTGTMQVRVSEKEREFLFSLGDRSVEELTAAFKAKAHRIDSDGTCLHDHANRDYVNILLTSIRRMNME